MAKALFNEVLLFLFAMNTVRQTNCVLFVKSNLQKWVTGRDCNEVHITGIKTWHWESCEKQRYSFCKLKTDSISLNNVCSISIQVQAQVFKTSSNDTNVLHVKTDCYYHDNVTKITETIGEIRNVSTRSYQWNLTTDSKSYSNISISFEDEHSGFCGEVQSLVVALNPCRVVGRKIEKVKMKMPATIIIQNVNSHEMKEKPNIRMTCMNVTEAIKSGSSSNNNINNNTNNNTRNCFCPPGYYNHKAKCLFCSENSFKPDTGNESCGTCGNNSLSSMERQTCPCRNKFFRTHTQQYNFEAPCIDIKPKNLNFMVIDGNNIVLSWKTPKQKLSIGALKYRVHCTSCEPYEHFKEQKNVNSNNTTFTMLKFNRFYHFMIIVSHQEDKIENILHSIQRSFFLAHNETDDDRTLIIVIGIMIPLIITCAVVVMLLYANQKKKNVYFQQKLTSLRRKTRPPPPPLTGTYRANRCNIQVDDDMESTITPYAVLNFKLNSLKKNAKDEYGGVYTGETKNLLENKETATENHAEIEDYVSMEANKAATRKEGEKPLQSKCIQNDYVIRPYNENINGQFHNMPPLRSRTKSCNIGNQSFREEPALEIVNNHRNQRANYERRSRPGSCYLDNSSRNDFHEISRNMPHHRSANHVQAQWTRTNSYYNQNGAWNNSPYFNGPMMHPRNSYDNQCYYDENDRYDEQQEIVHSAWPQLIKSRPRTRSCMVNDPNNNYYRPDYGRKYQPDFPPFPEIECRSRTESFYNNEPAVLDTPRNEPPIIERRNRSRTVCMEERTVDKLSILDQAKLKTKYKRAESREILCATDYVKLKRPHSADDVNIVRGMEF